MEDEVRKLLKENLETTKEIHKMVKNIDKYIFYQKVFWVIKFLLIVVPIILGIIYLPPLFENIIQKYQGLLNAPDNITNSLNNNVKELDINKLPLNIQKLLK